MKSNGILFLEYNDNNRMHHGTFSLQYQGNIHCKSSRHSCQLVGPFFYKIVDVHHQSGCWMHLAWGMQGMVCRKVGQEKRKKTYPQVDKKLYKEDVAYCCLNLCSMHIQVFFVHWLVHCHGSAWYLQEKRKLVKDISIWLSSWNYQINVFYHSNYNL